MNKTIRLPFDFDAQLLKEELKAFEHAWELRITPNAKEGTYWIIDLMVPDLAAERVDGGLPFKWNPILDKCPYFMKVLESFSCRFQRVIIRKLDAGHGFTAHTDYMYYERGEARIHIPIITDDLYEFYFNEERAIMLAGECWYLDTQLKHWGINKSQHDRIHLTMDCDVDEWLEDIFVNLGFPSLTSLSA